MLPLCDVSILSYTDSLRTFNSPMPGSKSSVRIRVTSELANGEVGFASVEDIIVQEPEGAETFFLEVPLLVFREGTNGDVTVSWSLRGAGENAEAVTASDAGPTQGTVTMVSGQQHVFWLCWVNKNLSAA